MKTRMSITRTIEGDLIFNGEVSALDMIAVNLDGFDRALLDDCNNSKNAADWLLALEMIFRRMGEQGNAGRTRLWEVAASLAEGEAK